MIEILGELNKINYEPGLNTKVGWICGLIFIISTLEIIFLKNDAQFAFYSGLISSWLLIASIYSFCTANKNESTHYLALIDKDVKYQDFVDKYEIVDNICGDYYEIKLKEDK